MRLKVFLPVFLLLVFFSTNAYPGFLDGLFKRVTGGLQEGPTEETIVSGLKEALAIGSQNAVTTLSRVDGYFANEIIKIPMPEKLQMVTTVLGNLGLQQQVDDFVLSMNRAAERAAPEAAVILVDAIAGMTIEDAKNILGGGDTAATDYFRVKSSDALYAAFEPIVVSAMDEVGVTRYYGQIVEKYESVPFMKMASLDLDTYVANGALEGLFYMVAQEEKKIRQDPTARVTELLETVFGK